MLAYACNPSTEETKAGRLRVQGQPGLHSKTTVSKKKKSMYNSPHDPICIWFT
jgi:hypothetical protein